MRAVGASTPAPRSSEGRDAWSLFAEVWADGHGLIDLLYGHRFHSPWPAAETLMTPCAPTWASPDQRAGAAGAEPVVASRRRRPPPGYDRRVRRDEIVEVVEVKPLTVADVPADDPERTAAQPPSRPQPLRA
jgi:hypothetical protein